MQPDVELVEGELLPAVIEQAGRARACSAPTTPSS